MNELKEDMSLWFSEEVFGSVQVYGFLKWSSVQYSKRSSVLYEQWFSQRSSVQYGLWFSQGLGFSQSVGFSRGVHFCSSVLCMVITQAAKLRLLVT